MNIILFEYIHYLAMMIGGLSMLAVSLILLTSKEREFKRTPFWRSLAFLMFAALGLLVVVERKFEELSFVPIAIEFFAILFLFIGLLIEKRFNYVDPDIVKLKNFKYYPYLKSQILRIILITGSLLILISLTGTLFQPEDSFNMFMVSISIIAAFSIVLLQVRTIRYRRRNNKKFDHDTIILLASCFILVRNVYVFLNNFPNDTDIVCFRLQSLDYSQSWFFAALLFALTGVFFLIATWKYVLKFYKQQLFILFLGLSVFVASIGSFIYTTLLLQVVEENNLAVLEQAVRSQKLIMEDRAQTAQIIASNIAEEPEVKIALSTNDLVLPQYVNRYVEESNLDIVKVYDANAFVVQDVIDTREIGLDYSEDQFVTHVLNQRKSIRSFDIKPGAVTDTLIARAIYPVYLGNNVVGAVEAGYKFDNAFADSVKNDTGFDVTIFNGNVRSANTITSEDGKSRWVGTPEVNQDVNEIVLNQSQVYSTQNNQLGVDYYISYHPVKNVNQDTISMLAAQESVAELVEDARQDLLTTFLIITNLCLLVSAISYLAVVRYVGIFEYKFEYGSSDK